MAFRPKLSEEAEQKIKEWINKTDKEFAGKNKAVEYLVDLGIEHHRKEIKGELTKAEKQAVEKYVKKLNEDLD